MAIGLETANRPLISVDNIRIYNMIYYRMPNFYYVRIIKLNGLGSFFGLDRNIHRACMHWRLAHNGVDNERTDLKTVIVVEMNLERIFAVFSYVIKREPHISYKNCNNKDLYMSGRLQQKILHIFGAISLVILASGILVAQTARILTIRDAIDISLKNNFELKRSRNALSTSEMSHNQGKANFYPSLTASSSSSQRYGRQFDQITGRIEDQQTQAVGMGANFNLNLFNGFSDVATLKKTEYQVNASELDYNRTKESTILKTVTGFLQIMLDNELIQIQAENLEAQKKQLELIQEYYDAGNRSIIDVLQQKSAISQAEYRLLSTQRTAEINKQNLFLTMGITPDGEYQYNTPSVDNLLLDSLSFNEEDLLKKAYSERSDLQSQNFQMLASEKQITVSQSGWWPTLSLSSNYQSNYSSSNRFSMNDQLFDLNRNAAFALSLSVPIFDRFRTKYSVETAKIQLSNTQLQKENLEQQIILEVKQGILMYRSLYNQAQVAEAQLDYARQALEAARERYQVGASTFVELSQVQASYVEAAGNLATAKINLLLQRIKIAYSTGDIEREIALTFNQ